MTEYADRASLVEIEEFAGTRFSATSFDMDELRSTTRNVDGSDTPNWNEVDEVGPFYTLDGKTPSIAGDVFERQALIAEGPAQRQAGAWKLIGNTRTPAARQAIAVGYVRVGSNWEAVSVPGSPMKTANGFRMYGPEGEELLRPAIGEQDLSNVTGLPLWADEAETIPVLVTA